MSEPARQLPPEAPPLNPAGEAEARRAELRQRRQAKAQKLKAERERRRLAAAERRATKKGPAAPPPESQVGASTGEAVAAAPLKTDDELRADLEAVLSLVWMAGGFLAGFLGYKLDPLTDREVTQNAADLVPIARRYVLVADWVGKLALPLRLVALVMKKAKPIPKKAPEPPPATAGDQLA